MSHSDRVRRRPPHGRSLRGATALEFALILPLLLGFALAAVDLGRYVLTTQRAAAAAAAAAELASQTERFTPEMDIAQVVTGREVAVLAVAAREVARPLPLLEDGALVVTLLANDGGGTAVRWQRRWGLGGGAATATANARSRLALGAGDAAVVAEVICQFRPWLLSGGLLGLPDIWEYRAVSVRRPRLGGPEVA